MFARSILYRGFSKFASIFKPDSQAPDSMWSGDYDSWDQAVSLCTGYDSDEILQKCAASILKVKNGEAVYERDSFLFNEIQYSWGLLAGLQQAALDCGGKLNVLDFGGSLGSTYFQNREFLGPLEKLRWNIIEQPNFVSFGQKHIQDDKLKFYLSIEDSMTENVPNVLLLSSVLQYLKTPYTWIQQIIDLNIPYIIVDRTAFNNDGREILTIQNVPQEIYQASYPTWFFNMEEFIAYFLHSYSVVGKFDSSFENPSRLSKDLSAVWKGFIFKNKKI